MMVRILLLQQRYNLSGEQLECPLLGRLSFQRFAGLRQSSQIPGRTTVWTFRERLQAMGATETLFDAANRELDKHGYLARGGQVIGAPIAQAPRQHNRKEEKVLIKGQAMPIGWAPAQRRQKDIEATWAKKHGKSYFGHTLSASADKRHKLTRKLKASTAVNTARYILKPSWTAATLAKACMPTQCNLSAKRLQLGERTRLCRC
jgi:transposase, IS5 family